MQYLKVDTTENAIELSRLAWLNKLGRAKKPEDITEYLYPVRTEYTDKYALLAIDTGTEQHLATADRAKMLPASNPDVKAVIDAKPMEAIKG